MATLTKARLSQIQEALNASIFTSMAFSVETGKNEKHVVTITFIDEPKFFITVNFENRAKFNIEALRGNGDDFKEVMAMRQCPGDCVEVENEDISSFRHFIDAIKTWTGRVRAELTFIKLLDKSLSDFQTQLNARLNEHFQDPSAHFTKEEREEMLAKLADIQIQIESMSTDLESNKSEIAEMKAVISELARATSTMPKKSWMRAACSKMYDITLKFASSQPGQKLLEHTIDRFLPPVK